MKETDDVESTDITLGTGKLLGLFLGLVVICAIFFSLGYAMGKNSGTIQTQLADPPATLPAGSTPAPKPLAGAPPEVVPSSVATDTAAPETPAEPATQPAESQPQPASPKLETASAKVVPVTGLVVQIAAVSKREDADILLSALKRKSYPAFIAATSDNLFHVQVGPFTDPANAKEMRDRLAADGYSPILKRQ